MGIREITGYIAYGLLIGYWLWVLAYTTPQLRRGCRDRRVRGKVLLIKTAGFGLTAFVVGVVHFWATDWWQVAVAVPTAAGLGLLLRRSYRRAVELPRHRRTLTHRARAFHRARLASAPPPVAR